MTRDVARGWGTEVGRKRKEVKVETKVGTGQGFQDGERI